VDLAVAAARKAFAVGSAWRTTDPSAKGKLIQKFADLIERDRATLAQLESLDNGKPVGDSDFDIGMAIDCLRYFAGWTDKIHGETIPVGKNLNFTYFPVFPFRNRPVSFGSTSKL